MTFMDFLKRGERMDADEITMDNGLIFSHKVCCRCGKEFGMMSFACDPIPKGKKLLCGDCMEDDRRKEDEALEAMD